LFVATHILDSGLDVVQTGFAALLLGEEHHVQPPRYNKGEQ
jgi:hypothetical protein